MENLQTPALERPAVLALGAATLEAIQYERDSLAPYAAEEQAAFLEHVLPPTDGQYSRAFTNATKSKTKAFQSFLK